MNIWPPVPGYYTMSLVRKGPQVPVRIWFGPPIIDGEEQDRAHDWRVEIDGRTDRWERGDDGYRCRVALDVDKAWPWCAKRKIDEPTYRYMVDTSRWAKQHAPDRPQASPREPVRRTAFILP